jgi:hypothetical protein
LFLFLGFFLKVVAFAVAFHSLTYQEVKYAGHTQKNSAVSEVDKKLFLSKVLMRYQQFSSHAYRGASFQDGLAAGEGFLCAPF